MLGYFAGRRADQFAHVFDIDRFVKLPLPSFWPLLGPFAHTLAMIWGGVLNWPWNQVQRRRGWKADEDRPGLSHGWRFEIEQPTGPT